MRNFERTDIDFHYVIATIPKNPIYPALHAAILEWLVDQRHVNLSFPGQNKIAFEAHDDICDAIRAHDPEAAAARMRNHLEQVIGLYWKVRRGDA
jgi:GntR family transcriptional repressor for pyruvate dehydrogenase complex